MTQNSEAGTPRHYEPGQYRTSRPESIRMDDSRRVQKSNAPQSRDIDSDWRKQDRATPKQHPDRRYVDRDREPKPFASHDEKLAAMEGSWKKNPEPAARAERRHARDDRDRYDRHGFDRQERLVERPERYGSSRPYQPRDQRDPRVFRDQREHYSDQAQGISELTSTRNSWPGESRGAKSRSKDSSELHGGDEYNCPLAGRGATHLKNVLDKEFVVCPRQDSRQGGLPNLQVTAAYLISYVVENLEEMEDGKSVECLIYGGEARAIVASEYNVEDPKARPTDLDLRFKIGKKSFESCRDVVEQFLLGRLTEKYPGADRSLVRSCYFQKQVVVSSQFSLLSIGDPKTGRNLDLEFTSSECTTRCFFDDANAFVIPLPDPASKGWKNVKPFSKTRGGAASQDSVKLMATSQSAPWQTAVDYIRKGQLNIAKPDTVFNGLPLYAHALSDKQLIPGSRELEREYGSEFAKAFIEQAEETYRQGQDPLRFLKSFLRSHYPSRPINALACLSQVLAILRAHAVLEESTAEREAIAKKLAESLCELCREALQSAASPETPRDVVEKVLEKVLQIVRFAENPFTADYRRDEKVVMHPSKNIVLQLRRQMSKDDVQCPLWEDVCKQAAELLMQRYEQDADEANAVRADMERVCEALKGLGNMDTDRVGKEISAESVEEQSSQYTDHDGSDQRSAVASCQSLGFPSSSSETSLGSSRSEDDESRSSTSATEETELDAVTPEARPATNRKSPQVQVQVDAEATTPASASPSPLSTPSSASRTPNSRRKTPNWGVGVYRPPGSSRRSTPNTPQS